MAARTIAKNEVLKSVISKKTINQWRLSEEFQPVSDRSFSHIHRMSASPLDWFQLVQQSEQGGLGLLFLVKRLAEVFLRLHEIGLLGFLRSLVFRQRGVYL